MSKVSEISASYERALNGSRSQYRELVTERLESARKFYEDFLRTQVIDFSERFASVRSRERIQELIGRVVGTKDLQFIAIDGTCRRQQFSEMVTFFGGAYGARGELILESGEHKIRYRKWSLDQDVSMVAWVPVPMARLEEVEPERRETFLVTDEERVSMTSIHVQIMQLAEVFLAYNAVNASVLEAPHLLLMDLSPSSLMASVARSQEGIGLVGYPYDRRALTKADILIALSQPIRREFGVPSAKRMDLYRLLVASLLEDPGRTLRPADLAERQEVGLDEASDAFGFLVRKGLIDSEGRPLVDPRESWEYTKDLFQNICRRLFLEKDPTALQYEAPDEMGVVRRRWLSPEDLGFLIAVGMRMLMESCWNRRILFYGLVKDSVSRYFSRNYLGVSLETGFHKELGDLEVGTLPWTDRMICEALPRFDENLKAPWGTVEFDSAFMTLHRERDEFTQRTKVAGVFGRIVNQERVFLKSLGQFFLSRAKSKPLMGHVVFLERLVHPVFDGEGGLSRPAEIGISTPELGSFRVFAYKDREQENWGQEVMMYLLSVLTRNHFAEAIGYPDPLHKADWGAKSMGRWVGQTIESSTLVLADDPLKETFRETRDSAGR